MSPLPGLAVAAASFASPPAVARDAPLATGDMFAMEIWISTVSEVPFLGDTRVVNRSLLLVEIEDEGGALYQRQQLCGVWVEDDARLSETRIPAAFVAATPEQRYPIALEADGDVWRYAADPGPAAVGYDPTLTGGAVPESPGDDGVIDWEGDGRPGATVELLLPVFGKIEIYIAQRGHSTFSGATTPGGAIEGAVETLELEQRILGATHRAFAIEPQIRLELDNSRFRLTPTEAVSCEALRATERPPDPS